VVGFDDISVAAFIRPRLTTVAVGIWEMGQRAAAVLLEKVRDEVGSRPPQRLVLPATLVIRESTGAPPVND
jgi:LacI family transcriptional regulator